MTERATPTTVTHPGSGPQPAAAQDAGPAGDGKGAAPRAGAATDAVAARPQRRPLTRGERRWLLVIVAVAAVLRIAWLAYAHSEPPVSVESGDQWSYWYYANEIADGRGYVSYVNGEATAYYPIGYPALLAAVFWLAEWVPLVDLDLMLVAGAFHAVVSVATVALTFVVGRRLVGPRTGLVAAGLLALFPNIVYQVTSLQLETVFVFVTMAALAIAVDHDWRAGPPSLARLLAFGVVLSVSALVRPFSAPLLLGLLLALLAAGAGWRRALAATAVPLLVLIVAFTPWTIRNAIRFDAFIPSSTNMGDTLCIDRNMDARGGFRWSTHDGCVDPDLPEAERNRGNTRKAIEFVIDHPDRELLQIARRARLIFAEDHDGILAAETMGTGPQFSDGERRLYETAGDWYFFAVGIAAVPGLVVLLRRSPRPERWLLVTPLAALLVIPLLLWGNPRFHLPLAPFMVLAAAALAAAVADRVAPAASDSPGAAASEPGAGSGSPVTESR